MNEIKLINFSPYKDKNGNAMIAIFGAHYTETLAIEMHRQLGIFLEKIKQCPDCGYTSSEGHKS